MNNINWWSQRSNLNNSLNNFLKSLEDLSTGPWACLLLGERSDTNHISKMIPKFIDELKLHCKFEASNSIASAILGGSKPMADLVACIAQYSISLTLRRCSYYSQHSKDDGFPFVNPSDTYYLLNPCGDLDSAQVEFEQWFRYQNWEGEAGKVPSAEVPASALQNHDLFLYFGHGSGMQYIPCKEIQSLNKYAASLLMGCSSTGSLTYKGCYAPRGAPLSYLFAGSPAVIANLWEVTDEDIDRFGKAML